MSEIKIGDVVRLKTGGAPMTVVRIETESVLGVEAEVAWFKGAELHRDTFPVASLEVAPKLSPLGLNPSPTYTAR